MKASDVKAGDKVRALDTAPGQFTAGKEYTVKSVGRVSISVELDDGGSRTNGWGFERFELVKPAFKVGDRVRRVDRDNRGNGATLKVGTVSTVARVDADGWLTIAGYEHLHGCNPKFFEIAPLFAVGDKVRAVRTSYGNAYIAGNTYVVKSAGDNHISTERDEHGSRTNGWGADNFEPAYTSCAAAEVDNLADEYGSPKPTKSEFKVGDRVRYNGKSKEYHIPKHIGTVGTVARSEGSGLTTTVDWDVVGPARNVYTENIELAPPTATLRIEAGRYYRTRDGRKVGPVRRFNFGDGYPFEVGDSYWVSESGKAQTGSTGPDLIAEWSDDVPLRGVSPVAKTVVAPATTAKFKVGDRVGCTTNTGCNYVIKGVDGDRVTVASLRKDCSEESYTFSNQDAGIFFLLPAPATVADSVSKPSIVCLIENGQPKPSTLPFVHADKDLAATEAARLAGKHPGQEFGVYELVTTRKEAKVYRFAWQNKASQGKKIEAIRSLRTLAGVSLKQARDTVDGFLADAASYESWLASEAA
ncbi:hypothetical protein NKJ71_13625 [Mesorhizobium sp. M0050]|uniref:hypothetical protein n=1 Tax=Mesorhizobium sp. M0050 TaxID=2956861 RepID=UPI00333BC9ED